MSVWGSIVAYLARWFPHRGCTGLYAVGSPDRNSPVIVTANFSLTVARVRRALKGIDAWLLVVSTDGINVWCAAAGGVFTHHRVIDAVKISRLAEKVDHRRLILPALSAPGVAGSEVYRATGFRVHFGPVYARQIPEYLRAGMQKSEPMMRFRFDLPHRLEMLVPMNFPLFALLALPVGVFGGAGLLAGFSLLFWAAATALYLLAPYHFGHSGWTQSLLAATAVVAAWATWDWMRLGNPLSHWGWYLATLAVFMLVGFDLAGIATARKSDAEVLLHRMRVKRLGALFSEKDLGEILLDRPRCAGCCTCWQICPLGVFGDLDAEGKVTFRNRSACFTCGACVLQCPEHALAIGVE